MRTRAYRRHQRARIKARHLRDYRELMSIVARDWPAPKDIAKRHPLDCGRSRCHCCHGPKLMDEPKIEDMSWRRYEELETRD